MATNSAMLHRTILVIRTLKYPLLVATVAAIVWYIRSLPLPVTSHTLRLDTVVGTVMGTGTLEARIQTTISPKIPGRVAKIFVDQGDLVKAGQLLVRLDDEDLAQQVRIATAGIGTAEATLGRFQAEIAQAKTSVGRTEADLNRLTKLLAANSISQSEFDQAQEAFDLARSGLLRADANLLEAQQQISLNRETLKFQEARLADSQLLAPFDGLVIERKRDPGSIVVPGSPILQLISLDELWISAWVDETQMEQLRAEQPARIVFRSQPNLSFDGTVARLGKQTDRETREFTVDVRVLKLPDTWAIGQRAEVYMETARVDQCLSLPADFLQRQDGKTGVYILDNNSAKWRQIEIGIEGRDSLQVIAGLDVNDVAIKPLKESTKLSDGQKVTLP